jgi:hypothetical protein
MLLCQGGATHGLEDAAGEVPLESSKGLTAGLAVVAVTADELARRFVVSQSQLGDSDAMESAVQPPVASPIESEAVRSARGGGKGGGAGVQGQLRIGS